MMDKLLAIWTAGGAKRVMLVAFAVGVAVIAVLWVVG